VLLMKLKIHSIVNRANRLPLKKINKINLHEKVSK